MLLRELRAEKTRCSFSICSFKGTQLKFLEWAPAVYIFYYPALGGCGALPCNWATPALLVVINS